MKDKKGRIGHVITDTGEDMSRFLDPNTGKMLPVHCRPDRGQRERGDRRSAEAEAVKFDITFTDSGVSVVLTEYLALSELSRPPTGFPDEPSAPGPSLEDLQSQVRQFLKKAAVHHAQSSQ